MARKKFSELHLSDILGFSRYIYLAMLLICIAFALYLIIPGIISTPSTFENVIMRPYEETVFTSAVQVKDGQAEELTAQQAVEIINPFLSRKVKLVQKAKPEQALFVLTLFSEVGEPKKSAPTVELTFSENYCTAADLVHGGGNIIKFKD